MNKLIQFIFLCFFLTIYTVISKAAVQSTPVKIVDASGTSVVSTLKLNSPPTGNETGIIAQAQGLATQPDGDVVADKADGLVFKTADNLAPGASFTTPIRDSDGWRSIELTVASDQLSAIDGIVVEFIEDTGAVSPVVRATKTFTFDNAYLSQGFAVFPIRVQLDGFRVRYTNGASATTNFFLEIDLRTAQVEDPSLAIESTIRPTDNSILTRSVFAGKKENGQYSNVDLSNSGSVKVAVTDRPSEVRNRTVVEAKLNRTALSATNNLIYTVTPGKTLYIESFVASTLNSANEVAEWRLRDASSDKMGFLLGERTLGAGSVAGLISPPLPEPIPFSSNVSVNEVSGAIEMSFWFIGYEE